MFANLVRRVTTPTVAALVVAAVGFGASVVAVPDAVAQQAAPKRARETICLGPNAIQDAIHANRARRLAEFRGLLDGEIVRADLCPDGEGLVYRVTVLKRDGLVRRVVVDAVSGQFMYTGR